MKYVNLTGHEIHELDSGLRIAPSDTVIRSVCKTESYVNEDGVTCYRSIVTGLSGKLPDPVEGTVYLVSALALNAIPDDRTDVLAPKQVERHNGIIIGCRGFRHK